MAKKLALQPSPTFKAKVDIHVPGGEPVKVEFTFKAKKKSELRTFMDGIAGVEDADLLMGIASGWDLEDAFTKENVALLCDNYLGAALSVWDTYLSELNGARLGN